MPATAQLSSKTPTVRRILKEATELATQPSAEYHAAPLESDMFEWHFTIRGPPAPSPFAGGLYHGRIALPPAYPLKPPSFRFLTPTGRFEVNREVCLSISGHHEETWQPAWGVRTALVALRSFMDTDARGQLGGMDAPSDVRRRLAASSPAFRCAVCARANDDIMRDQEEACKEQGAREKTEDAVPEELRLAYRDELGVGGGGGGGGGGGSDGGGSDGGGGGAAAEKRDDTFTSHEPKTSRSDDSGGGNSSNRHPSPMPVSNPAAPSPPLAPRIPNATLATPAPPRQRPQPRRHHPDDAVPPWIDKAIYGILAALIFFVLRRWIS